MPIFSFKAKKGPRQIIESNIEAESKEVAIAKIDQMGYVPISVTLQEKSPTGAVSERIKKKGARRPTIRLKLFERIRPRDITMFTEQLSSLLKAKVSLFEAINILSTQTENALLREVIAFISDRLKDGNNLSDSMSKYPRVFPVLYINMIRSGESGGILEQTLERLVEFRQEEEEIKTRITSALAYPAFIVIVGLLTIFVLLTFGIPRLVSVFSDVGQALPLPTRILISISGGIRNYWYWFLIIIAFLFFLLRRVISMQKIIFDKFKLNLPILGDFLKKGMLARFSRTFATLLANGIPVFQALQIIIPAADNEIFKKELERIHTDIIAGSSFARSLKESYWFPAFMTNMITVAEKGGNLQEALLEVARFYERELAKTTKVMTSLLEPAIILVMGLLVGFIVMAMLLPIFQINLGTG